MYVYMHMVVRGGCAVCLSVVTIMTLHGIPTVVLNPSGWGCVPDEYAAIAREIRSSSGLIGNHSYHLKVYKNCFIGKELVQWLMKTKNISELYSVYMYM